MLPAIVDNVNSSACTIPIERHRVSLIGAGLELSPRALAAAEPEFPKTISQGRIQWLTVSSVTCHVTWRVMEVQWAIGLFNKKKTFCSDCGLKPAIRVG